MPSPKPHCAVALACCWSAALRRLLRLALPKSCLVGPVKDSKATVFVVRDGHARLMMVEVGEQNDRYIAVLKGISTQDDVILRPPSGLKDGAAVTVADQTSRDEDSP